MESNICAWIEHFFVNYQNEDVFMKFHADTIYATTQTGSVIEIKNGKIGKEIRFAKQTQHNCDGSFDSEPVCGRPLGLRRLTNETLIVADAYLGIFTVDFQKETFTRILDGDTNLNGLPLLFINDLDVINEDQIIFTHSSSRWNRRHFLHPILEGIADGRVISLELSSGKLAVLVDKLHYANGIQMFPDKQSFLVSETALARIRRHWISGPKKGKTEIFAENLPGLPDNIRPGNENTFWVALPSVRYQAKFSLFDFLSDKPCLRSLLLQIVPARLWAKLLALLPAERSIIVQLNSEGKIIRSAHDPNGQLVKRVSQVVETDEHLYLASYHAEFIARIHKTALTTK